MAPKPSSSTVPVSAATKPSSKVVVPAPAAEAAFVAAARAPPFPALSSAAAAGGTAFVAAASSSTASSSTMSSAAAAAAAAALEAVPEDMSLVVGWCGAKYQVTVARKGTLGDLKARIFVATGLPTKRQRIRLRWPRDKRPDLVQELHNDRLELSTLPLLLNPKVELRIFGMKEGPYKNMYWDMYWKSSNQLVRGNINVTDTNKFLRDFNGAEMNLSAGFYKAEFLTINCCIRKVVQEEINLLAYPMIKRFVHPNAVAIEGFYRQNGQICLVLSTVDGTFEGWALKNGAEMLFFSANDGTRLSQAYRGAIIDLCKVLENLLKAGLCLRNISARNLYVKLLDDVPKIKLLIYDVEFLANDETLRLTQINQLWTEVTQMITSSLQRSCFPPFSITTQAFCNFIEKQLPYKLEAYPDQWGYQEKGAYLLIVVSKDLLIVQPLIKASGIVWPKKKNGRLPTYINRMIKAHLVDNIRYDKKDPYDYIRVLRNSFKRFNNLPHDLQIAFGSKEGLIDKIEEWSPEIWRMLFEAVG